MHKRMYNMHNTDLFIRKFSATVELRIKQFYKYYELHVVAVVRFETKLQYFEFKINI